MPGRIPQSFINDLIERVDIVEVIDSRVSLKRAGKNLQALCPFHEEKTPSFSVNSDSGKLIPLETYPLGNAPVWVSITELPE